jgi:hypothetical protein
VPIVIRGADKPSQASEFILLSKSVSTDIDKILNFAESSPTFQIWQSVAEPAKMSSCLPPNPAGFNKTTNEGLEIFLARQDAPWLYSEVVQCTPRMAFRQPRLNKMVSPRTALFSNVHSLRCQSISPPPRMRQFEITVTDVVYCVRRCRLAWANAPMF